MFGIGVPELILIAIVALIVVGPKKLPDALRAIGRALGEFRKVTSDLREEVDFDNVVNEVSRPLREGMAQIEKDVRSMDAAKKGKVVEGSLYVDAEYPEEGPDDYGALPEAGSVYPDPAPAYPEVAPVYRPAEARAIEDTVSRADYVDDDG